MAGTIQFKNTAYKDNEVVFDVDDIDFIRWSTWLRVGFEIQAIQASSAEAVPVRNDIVIESRITFTDGQLDVKHNSTAKWFADGIKYDYIVKV